MTVRDIAIFQTLAKYRYLRSTYLHAFVGGASETRIKERLGDLFHEGFLDRPEAQWQFASARYQPAVYELGLRGTRLLAEAGDEAPLPVTFLSARQSRQFQHAVLICGFLASIELATRASACLRFIGWPEILERAPSAIREVAMPFRIALGDAGLVPDALFGLEYSSPGRKAYRFCAVEVDRGTMPVSRSSAGQTSYASKLASYREVIARALHRSHWGISTLLVLTLTTTEVRLASMLNHARDGAEDAAFLFKALADLPDGLVHPDHSLLSAPWRRASLSDVVLDRS